MKLEDPMLHDCAFNDDIDMDELNEKLYLEQLAISEEMAEQGYKEMEEREAWEEYLKMKSEGKTE